MMLNHSDNSSSSSRKTLLERLAALRIQSSSPTGSSSASSSSVAKAPESPHYIPRSTQNPLTKAKFNGYTSSSKDKDSVPASSQSEQLLSSPSIGRRRKFSGLSGTTGPLTQARHSESPIGVSSPKYFPKQKVLEITEPIQFPNFAASESEEIHRERNHSAKEVVTSFIDSFTILNNFLIKSSNSTTAKLHLQNLNNSFAALQMDLKNTLKTISHLRSSSSQTDELKSENANLTSENKQLRSENDALRPENTQLTSENDALRSENDTLRSESNSKELEEQLKIALSQISEIKIAYEKEKENVEFLQNYMEEVIQLKDEGENQVLNLEKKISDLMSCSESYDLKAENEKLKETLKLLELERSSNKNVCKQALQVLDAAARSSSPLEEAEKLQLELKQKQVELEKLRGREQHFKESNEIFQQKLMILTEENRKLRGQRPINHY